VANGTAFSVTNSAAGGYGVVGFGGAPNAFGVGVGGVGVGRGTGVEGDGGDENGDGVVGFGGGTSGRGVGGVGAGRGTGVEGDGGVTNGDGVVGFGGGTSGRGVAGVGSVSGPGVLGVGGVGDPVTRGVGVEGVGPDTAVGFGVLGISGGSSSGVGVQGQGRFNVDTNGIVGFGGGSNGVGVRGVSAANGGLGTSTFAARFEGNVVVTGTLSKGAGSFKIDHPLDPENKYLYHSFVESPDMMNIYNGNAVLDAKGEAVIVLPEWFEALNRDFRYQLTCIGGFARVYVAEEISNNRFRVAGGKRGTKVSWQVTGIRRDAFAQRHPIRVEEEKPENERGYYLHPEAYGEPPTKGIGARQRADRPQD
jgi:hypothetical protein